MPQTAEQFGNLFDEFGNLPRFNDTPTLKLVNFVKTHQDQDNGA